MRPMTMRRVSFHAGTDQSIFWIWISNWRPPARRMEEIWRFSRAHQIAGIAGVNAAVRLSGRESVQRAQRYCDCAGCGDFADFAGLVGLAGGAGSVCGAAA